MSADNGFAGTEPHSKVRKMCILLTTLCYFKREEEAHSHHFRKDPARDRTRDPSQEVKHGRRETQPIAGAASAWVTEEPR